MKISCMKTDLLNGVNIALKAVPNKTTMNILECLMIVAENGSIKFISNDTEMGIETTVDGEITENGVIALDAKLFSEVVKKLPDGAISIEVKDDLTTTIKSQKSKFKLLGRKADDFISLPEVEKSECITVSQYTLKEVIQQTIFSVADNDTNKMMTGELFEVSGDKLRVVALDGHRIAIRNIGLKKEYKDKKLIIPGKTLGEISKVLSGEVEKDVNIYYTDKHVLFEFDNTILVSRLIDGEFFKFDQMFTGNYDTKITVNRKTFLDSIERATLLAKEGDKKPVVIGIEDDSIEIKMISTIGSMNEMIDVEKEGNNLQIGFNPRFLIDVVRVIADENITFYMMNAKSPCFIEDELKTYNYIVLPVNFNQVR